MDTQATGNPIWDAQTPQTASTGNPVWDQQSQPQQQTTSANPYWDTPQDVSKAQQQLGSQADNGECETFVEQMTGSPNMGRSATEAWQNYANQGKTMQGTQGMKPGDKIYFYDPNQPNGHTGIVQGNNKFISATPQGVKSLSISDWLKYSGQQILGYIPQ